MPEDTHALVRFKCTALAGWAVTQALGASNALGRAAPRPAPPPHRHAPPPPPPPCRAPTRNLCLPDPHHVGAAGAEKEPGGQLRAQAARAVADAGDPGLAGQPVGPTAWWEVWYGECGTMKACRRSLPGCASCPSARRRHHVSCLSALLSSTGGCPAAVCHTARPSPSMLHRSWTRHSQGGHDETLGRAVLALAAA